MAAGQGLDQYILKALSNAEPAKARHLAQILSKEFGQEVLKSDVNSSLYRLKSQGLVDVDSQFHWSPQPLNTPPKESNQPMPNSDNEPVNTQNDTFMHSAFEDMRKKLLDTAGSRSKLINLDQSRKGIVRIVDELPDELAKTLLSEKSMHLRPIPEPTEELLVEHGYIEWDEGSKRFSKLKGEPSAKEWAGVIGIHNSYELPEDSALIDDGRHTDLDLQTMLFEPELNKYLKKLATEARTSIEETGNNILFLSLGFLEWFDQAEGGRSRLAPLFMIPVKIEKEAKKSIQTYKLSYTGEDIIPNLTLREKLSVDFGLILPDVVDESDNESLLSPEAYFKALKKGLEIAAINDKNVRQWRVHRYATLATLSLGKLLMYLDLDPGKWPTGEDNILEHDVVKAFFNDSSDSNSGAGMSDEVYVLDDVPRLHEDFPMIEDADSSQMSVIIDVLGGDGSHMVVEGPPGTGKSQTITNLIAGALSQGKTVLFVAEKQAALDVVKRRLDKAQLGDFCLDLHSDKAQKRMILDSINERIQNTEQYKFSASEFDIQLGRYERARSQLQEYAQLVNRPWKDTGLTIHEILTAATLYKHRVEPLNFVDVAPDEISSDSFSAVMLDDRLESLELFYNYMSIVSKQLGGEGDWTSHPWFGVQNKALGAIGPDTCIKKLEHWNSSFGELHEALLLQSEVYALPSELSLSLDAVDALVSKWAALPTLRGQEYVPALSRIKDEDIAHIERALNVHMEITLCYKRLSAVFNRSYVETPSTIDQVERAVNGLLARGVDLNVSLAELFQSTQNLQEVIKQWGVIADLLLALKPRLSKEANDIIATDKAGLREFEILVNLAVQLPTQLIGYRDSGFDNDEIDIALKSLKLGLESIEQQKTQLEETFHIEKLPPKEELGIIGELMAKTTIFSWFKSDWRAAKQKLSSFTKSEKPDYKAIAPNIEKAAHYLVAVEKLETNQDYKDSFGILFKGVNSNTGALTTLREWYKNIRGEYGIGFGRRVPLAETLFRLPDDILKGIHNACNPEYFATLSSFRKNLDELALVFKKEDVFTSDHLNYADDPNPFRAICSELTAEVSVIQQSLIDPSQNLNEVSEAITHQKTIIKQSKALAELDIAGTYFDNTIEFRPSRDISGATGIPVIQQTLDFVKALGEIEDAENLQYVIRNARNADEINAFNAAGRHLQVLWLVSSSAESEFLALIDGTRKNWFGDIDCLCADLESRNNRAITNPEWLDSWLKYLFAKARMEAGGFAKLNNYLTENRCDVAHAKNVLNFAIYTRIAQEVYKSVPSLSERSGHEQTALQQQFGLIDDGLKALQRRRVGHLAASTEIPAGTSGARVSSYTEDYLIRHEIAKKSRNIAIRSLVSRAGQALKGYKPCFMMSPMAVAKYLPPDSVRFDLVIMDEASQVKPEYALSSFARGSKVVVVGDPKQLPPTTFFEKVGSTDEFEDKESAAMIQDSESILDAVANRFKGRSLKWHYRSQHESLIAFSNHKFYDSKLIVFPSPWNDSPNFGINFNHVSSGRFLSSVNATESAAVIQGVRKQLIERPTETVGIVAMNSKQRDQIEADLEAALANDPLFKTAYTKMQDSRDPVFVKNLENVQGDERDIIYISFTYGPQERGAAAMPQRFGPINGATGWRRLNVLFTRAKKRVEVFSSMVADQIILTEASSRGVHALKGYLEFAQTGRLIGATAISEGEPDSDFEVSVIEALEKHGFECVAQVGVAGFFIDIAVKDPGMPGRYLMGIECDGATYHSSKSTRDRDRVRQSVLEGLDWKIRRIWSTDWFMNPAAELRVIVDELNELATKVSEASPIEVAELVKSVDTVDVNKAYEQYGMGASKSLEQRLTEFAVNIIESELPNTPHDRRLLRPDMLERLIADMPTNREDFTIFIPGYLRTHTDATEASRYLGDVLEIISEYESTQGNAYGLSGGL
jgi:very-short-patch-repair endonuclease